METIIVYADDAAYAQPLIDAALQAPRAASAHWVLVACAPRITHRVSRFVSNRTRENWRNKWADKLFQDMQPALEGKVAKLSTVLARGPLQELMESWQAECGAQVQVMDLRRPKMHTAATVPAAQTVGGAGLLGKLSGSVTGVGAIWVMLAGDVLAA